MAADKTSWRDQLNQVRQKVETKEQQRVLSEKQALERSREAMAERLKRDTPQAILTAFNGVKEAYERTARKLYPPKLFRAQFTELGGLGEKLRFYREGQKEYADLFTGEHRQIITRLLGELGELQRGMERQLKQWEPIETVMQATVWKKPTPADAPQLLEISKIYNQHAFEINLSLPSDFYAAESENMLIADYENEPYGFVKYWAESDSIALGLMPFEDVNFRKLMRGFLHTAYTASGIKAKTETVRLRLNHPAEFKFFADLGFARAETKDMTLSIYQWPRE